MYIAWWRRLTMVPGFRFTHPWPFSKSKFNLKSDCVNLVAPASSIECLRYLPNVRSILYKLGPENWPGSEIQMYYGCPWIFCCRIFIKILEHSVLPFEKNLCKKRDFSLKSIKSIQYMRCVPYLLTSPPLSLSWTNCGRRLRVFSSHSSSPS